MQKEEDAQTIGQQLAAMPQTYLECQPPSSIKSSGWDVLGEIDNLPRGSGAINSVQWDNQGKNLISGGKDATIRIYSVEKELTKAWENKAHSGPINHITCNPVNDQQFGSVSSDGSLKVWDRRNNNSMKPVNTIKCKEELINGQFSPDGTILAIHTNCNQWDNLTFYDTRMWQETRQIKFKTEVEDFMWDRTGSAIFVADHFGSIQLFEGALQSAKNQAAVVLSGVHVSGRCDCLCMHPDNQSFVSGGSDSLIGFWDFEDFMCTGTLSSNEFQVRCLDFSPCGSLLAALVQDEKKKRESLELYTVQNGIRKQLCPITTFESAKKQISWHPVNGITSNSKQQVLGQSGMPLLALCGESDKEKEQGLIRLMKPKLAIND